MKKIPERKSIKQEDKWDLSPLFKTDEEWDSLYNEIEKVIPGFDSFRGKMGESFDKFYGAIKFSLDISRKTEKLYTYAHLKSDEDKSDQHYLGLYQRAINLYTRISESSSFITPEIQSIDEKTLTGFLSRKELDDYKFYLEQIIRYRPHTLGLEIEKILAMSGEMSQAASQVFSQLDNADIKFGTIIDENGAELELSHGNFNSFLIKHDREIRKKAFFQYYQSYDNLKNTIASALSYSYKKDSFYSRVRNFESSRNASLFSDNVPVEVYDNLIETVKKNISPLTKYLDFRKKSLGLQELHFYDTYVPIMKDINFNMPYEEAVDTCVKALAPLGEEYTSIMKNGLLHGWVDRYENRGKRSGAYSSGCYDSPPYILLNYEKDNINSLYTLIHEAGHSMHSYYSKKNQPYVTSDYTIFVAEVASTFNETLLSSYLMEKYKDDNRMMAYIINREIDNIRGTLFRQTMFAEFEREAHKVIWENNPLTLQVMRDIYRNLLKTYFGGSVVIDEELTLEFLRIPHFYSSFYVYKYSTGISAAIALAENVINGDTSARDRYLEFLKLGGSMFPIDQLKKAGVDMSSPEPVQKAINHFAQLSEKLENLFQKI